MEGPGQFLRHYAPNIESYLFDGKLTDENLTLKDSVLIDYNGLMKHLEPEVNHYIDMSSRGSFLEAVKELYDVLRWSETKTDSKSVLIANVLKITKTEGEGNEHRDALFDRIYRATSGKLA